MPLLKLFRRRTAAPSPRPTASIPPIPPALEPRPRLAEVPYLLPKDVQEDQRLNFQHHVLYRTISNHYLAPLAPETTRTILDVGAGAGIWCMEMANLFPGAQIVGVDVALSSLPHPLPNGCLFCQANILQGLPFPDRQFDFTHQRLLVAAIPAAQWPAVVLYGIDPDLPHRLSALARRAGLRHVQEHHFDIPLGEWAGHIGRAALANARSFSEAPSPRFTRQLNLDFAIVRDTWRWLVREWNQAQARVRWYVVVGQR